MSVTIDWTVPLSDSELADLIKLFKSMPSYKDENDAISTNDFPVMLKEMGYERTPEQTAAYQKYWDEKSGGKLTKDEFVTAVTTLRSTSEYFAKTYAVKFDTDGDGFISVDEFKPILELLSTHDPTIAGISYEEFIKQADKNNDGKVSIDECAGWIEKHSTSASA